MGLAISIPEKKVSAWIAETTVSGTSGWISRLPVADSLESARDLYQALYTLNRMEVAPRNRLELMELYRSPVSQVSGQLQGRVLSAAFPLSPQRFRLAEFVRDLQVEMAYGYKLALFDMETHRRPIWGKTSGRAKAIFRSIHYLGNTLLRSGSCYLAYPKGIWKEVHSLYQHALIHKCANEPVEEFDQESDRYSTVEKRYKEILLLGIADPYRMPVGQSSLVNGFVYRWADLAELATVESKPGNPGQRFIVDPESDAPGKLYHQGIKGDFSGSTTVLNISVLRDHVHAMLRRLDTGATVRELDLGSDCLEGACRDMLLNLASALVGAKPRGGARIPINGDTNVCTGLVPIHHFVHQQQLRSQESRPQLLGKGDGRFSSNRYNTSKWELVNASAGGAMVRGQDASGVNVRIGDLVALMDTGNRKSIKLFAVRWMKERGSSGLEVGLEMLSENISSVLVGQERDGGSYVPALMLEKGDQGLTKVPRTLVLQKDLRGKQKDIELLEAGDKQSKWVRILESIDRTNTYERVTFVSLSRRDK